MPSDHVRLSKWLQNNTFSRKDKQQCSKSDAQWCLLRPKISLYSELHTDEAAQKVQFAPLCTHKKKPKVKCDRQEACSFTSGSRCRRTVDLHHISASCGVKAESAVQLSFSSFRTSRSWCKAAVAAARANSSATPSRTLPASFPQQQKGAGVRLRNAIPHEPRKEAACQMSPTPEGEKCFIPPFCQNPIPILPSRAPCLTWLHWWKMLKFETATSFQKPFKYRSH